jgi:hypothetical protein
VKEKKQKFIRILTTEIEDLIDDIEHLMVVYKNRCEKGEITNYVYLENNALLKNEISCLKNFIKFLSKLELDKIETIEELYLFIGKEFKQQLEEHCYAHSIENFVERKLQKVINYIKSEGQ